MEKPVVSKIFIKIGQRSRSQSQKFSCCFPKVTVVIKINIDIELLTHKKRRRRQCLKKVMHILC